MRLAHLLVVLACAATPVIAAEKLPKYNPRTMCEAMGARSNLAGTPAVKDFIKSCIGEEEENLSSLRKEYARYRPELLRECVSMSSTMGYCIGFKTGSYRVLLNCLREGKMPDELWRNVKCTPGKVNKIEFTGPPPEKKVVPRNSPGQSGR